MFVILKKMNSFYVHIYSHGDIFHSLYRFTKYSPVIDHPRCEDFVFAYRRRSFTRIERELHGISSGNSSRQIYSQAQILLRAFCRLRSSMLSLTLNLSEQREHTMTQVVAYKRFKTMENYKEWSRSLMRVCRLREVLLEGFDWENLVFWRGGRSWEVVAHKT